MNDYREVRIDIDPCNSDGTDILAYYLAEEGFESFVPDDHGLTAYIREQDYSAIGVNNALAQYPYAASLNVSTKTIEGQDWNKEWEKNYFKPIIVDNRCVIHSSFHTDVPNAEYDIIIDPKMAFGTGHHATTSQVIRMLLGMNIESKTITDMGTGTGILAILAAMSGASHVTGIEIDEFAYMNAKENVAINHVEDKVTLLCGDARTLKDVPKADVFLANINRNVILDDMAEYANNLKDKACVVFSGFYDRDIEMIVAKAETLGLTFVKKTTDNEWACVLLKADK
ncbi:MAG: 50S ribosomal protein L11 methyltransferase [Muribaculaceae bacterium]|nr:50S ribosomal protein L11 methyltransferase [Muribaculaceae bacterium]